MTRHRTHGENRPRNAFLLLCTLLLAAITLPLLAAEGWIEDPAAPEPLPETDPWTDDADAEPPLDDDSWLDTEATEPAKGESSVTTDEESSSGSPEAAEPVDHDDTEAAVDSEAAGELAETVLPETPLPKQLLDPRTLTYLGYEVAWKSNLRPSATPQWVDGILYVEVQTGLTKTVSLHALDADTGRALWVYPLHAPLEFPVICGEKTAYALAGTLLHAIDTETGTSRMKKNLAFAPSTGPTLDGDALWCTAWNGDLHRLNTRDGKRAKTISIGSVVTVPLAALDSYVLVCGEEGMAYAILRRSGKVFWSHKTGGAVRVPPAILGNTICLGLDSYRVIGLDAGDGLVTWQVPMEGPVERPLHLLANGVLLASATGDSLVAIDAKTGNRLWKLPHGFGPIAVSEDRLVIELDAGGIVGVNPADGGVLWEHPAADIQTFLPNASHQALHMIPKVGGVVALRPVGDRQLVAEEPVD